MNTSALQQSLFALGERLSRAPRRLAAAVALLAVLAVGGAGTWLAAAPPPHVRASTPGAGRALRASRQPDHPWERHFDRGGHGFTAHPAPPALPGQ